MLNLNLKEYIESGILELFVCNALVEKEMLEVSNLIQMYPLLLKEVQEIEDAFIKMAEKNSQWKGNIIKIRQVQ